MVHSLCVWCLEYNDCCRRCSRCRGPWYCSLDCQMSHWSAGHRNECWGNSFVRACVQLPTVLKDMILDRFVFSEVRKIRRRLSCASQEGAACREDVQRY